MIWRGFQTACGRMAAISSASVPFSGIFALVLRASAMKSAGEMSPASRRWVSSAMIGAASWAPIFQSTIPATFVPFSSFWVALSCWAGVLCPSLTSMPMDRR